MLEFPRWKYVLILIVVLASALYALPNLYPQDPSVQITANRGFAIDDALRARIDTALKQAGVQPKQIEVDDGTLLVRLPGLDEQTKANDALRQALGEDYLVALNLASTVPDWLGNLGARPMVQGLDLQGGVHFVLQVDQKAALDKRVEGYLEDIRVTLRDKRIRYTSVERRPNNSIVVTLAADEDAAAAQQRRAIRLFDAQQGSRPVADRTNHSTRSVDLANDARDLPIAGKVEHRALSANEVHRVVGRRIDLGQRQRGGDLRARQRVIEESVVGRDDVVCVDVHRRFAAARAGDVHLVAVGDEGVVRPRQLGQLVAGIAATVAQLPGAGDHGQYPAAGRRRCLHELERGHRAGRIGPRLAGQIQVMPPQATHRRQHREQHQARDRHPLDPFPHATSPIEVPADGGNAAAAM